MKSSLIVLGGSLLVAGLALAAALPRPASGPEDVSILRLIAAPEAYDGKEVSLLGYVQLEFEGTAIYLHETDGKCAISRNALWLDVPDFPSHKEADRNYCLVKGTFHAGDHGHMGMFSGAIDKITVLSKWCDSTGFKPSGTEKKLH